MSEQPLWRPGADRIEAANITRFRREAAARYGVDLPDSHALWQFSVDQPEAFWTDVRDFAGLEAATWGKRTLVDWDKLPGGRLFPDARLNFAENLLQRRDDADAIVFWGEDKLVRRISFAALYDRVSVLAQALEASGVGPGDTVAAYLPNMPETIVAMLAAVSRGATFSSCSPDFGVQGVLDRFGQIEPKVLFFADGYWYNGKRHDVRDRAAEVLAALPTVERAVMIPYGDQDADLGPVDPGIALDDFVHGHFPQTIPFARMPFDHPLYIMFSSGTTGVPKCIVHRAGGVLLKHACEQVLHGDTKADDRVFYFTTCGWMMWNWLVTHLAWGATVVLFDGSPFAPSGNILFDLADAEKVTHFGTSAKYIDALAKAGLEPRSSHDLSTVRTLYSTGSPLVPEGFDYVYGKIKTDIHLASISGGTDIVGVFCGGDPTLPVWRGEIQCRLLGMAVDVFDDDGNPVREEKGELVCTRPFPTVPLGFLGDDTGRRLHDAYFAVFDNVWTHGDYVMLTKRGGIVVFGRSDATLNPGGVRIGTAEIYRQVEKLPEVQESIVVGQEWDGDVRVVLFVVLGDGRALDDDLAKRIRTQIRDNCTPRHVPAKVIQVTDIPRTKSGKITELAVRDVIHGRDVNNKEALANPEALEQYAGIAELQS